MNRISFTARLCPGPWKQDDWTLEKGRGQWFFGDAVILVYIKKKIEKVTEESKSSFSFWNRFFILYSKKIVVTFEQNSSLLNKLNHHNSTSFERYWKKELIWWNSENLLSLFQCIQTTVTLQFLFEADKTTRDSLLSTENNKLISYSAFIPLIVSFLYIYQWLNGGGVVIVCFWVGWIKEECLLSNLVLVHIFKVIGF